MIGSDSRQLRIAARWAIGSCLFIILCLLRLPWREADPGNSAFWSYGFFSTDEAGYTAGGRIAFLTRRFLDPEVSEPYTFINSWGMHFLTYLGYRLDGLTLGAPRWPTMLAAVVGWLAAYALTSRRTSAWAAGLLVLIVSCNPASLTFERVASTDVTIGSLTILAFVLVTSRRLSFAAIAGAAMALAMSVKPTTVVLLPLVVLGLFTRRDAWLKRLMLASGSFLIAFGVLWFAREQCIRAAAVSRDTATVLHEISRGTPSLGQLTYKLSSWTKSLSIFPRWPNGMLLGPFLIWVFALPVWCILLAWQRGIKMLTLGTAISAGLLLYLGALATQWLNPLRYFLPPLYFVPILLVCARGLVVRTNMRPSFPLSAGVAGVVLLALYWWQPSRHLTADQIRLLVYNEYTLPDKAAWTYLGLRAAVSLLVICVALRAGKGIQHWIVIAGIGVSFVWVFFTSYTVSMLSVPWDFVRNQLLVQLGLLVMCVAMVAGGTMRRWQSWYLLQAGVLLAFIVLNGYWSQAYKELGIRTYYTLNASRSLAAVIPSDAMVIGRRASTLLRNTPLHVGMCHFSYAPDEFLAKVTSLLESKPRRPLYWLVDGDGCAPWEWYQRAGKPRWNVAPVTIVQVPSADQLNWQVSEQSNLPLVPVYLMRITSIVGP